MRSYKPMGMLLLAGVAFLALIASSASARTGAVTAEPAANDVVVLRAGESILVPPGETLTIDPVVLPPVVPTPIDREPWPVAGPSGSGGEVRSIQFDEPVAVNGGGVPIDPDPSGDVEPIPIVPLFEIV